MTKKKIAPRVVFPSVVREKLMPIHTTNTISPPCRPLNAHEKKIGKIHPLEGRMGRRRGLQKRAFFYVFMHTQHSTFCSFSIVSVRVVSAFLEDCNKKKLCGVRKKYLKCIYNDDMASGVGIKDFACSRLY